ncbi:MAG: hypothetical protein Q4G69_08800 [Planctomycetia bacterium]|nr:hypothetical protein [Planctomycetia bacterium]
MAKTAKKNSKVSSASAKKATAPKAAAKKATDSKAKAEVKAKKAKAAKAAKVASVKATAAKTAAAAAGFERLNVRMPSSEKAKVQKIVDNLGTSNSKYALACFKSRWEQESGKPGKTKFTAPTKAKKAKRSAIKDNHIEFHFSPDEKKKIVKAAKRAGMGASQYVRDTLFE